MNFSARTARLLGVPFLLLAGVRCAHVEPPSGGPVDATPPAVAAVYPAPGAVGVPRDARVILQFTEWIDRSATRGTAMISPPHAGRVRVEVDGDRLIVRPPAGQTLRPNTTYNVTVLGTLKDLRGNGMGRVFALRFSTGAALDSAGLEGRLSVTGQRGPLLAALYHVNGRESLVEKADPRDTGFAVATLPAPGRELPAFVAGADSSGRFALDGAVPGDYAVFAFEDVNGNFAFDVGLEAAATGEAALALRPRAPAQSLRLVPLDTLPLRLAEVTFAADTGGTAALPAGVLHVKFSRAPHPARAAEAARYAVLPDSGSPLPVTAAGWDPESGVWVLATPPLRAGVRHRLITRARPDFPGRHGADEPDTSAPFDVTAAVDSAAEASWSVKPLRDAGGLTGLTTLAAAPAAETRQTFLSSRPLTSTRWARLETRLESRVRRPGDTAARMLPHRLQRLGPTSFAVQWTSPLRPGDALEMSLRSAPPPSLSPAPTAAATSRENARANDSVPASRVLYAGTVPDSARTPRLNRVRVPAPAGRADGVYWALDANAAATAVTAVTAVNWPLRRVAGDTLESAPLPPGRYVVHGFLDRDRDGVWNPGAIRPWIPQEPYEVLPDTLTIE